MPLQHRGHRDAGDLVDAAWLEMNEFHLRAEDREIDRKRRLVLLPAQRRLQPVVAAVDHDPVSGNEGRHEERQPHDVVPVQVRQEDVEGLRGALALRRGGLTERPQAAAHVADEVVGAAGFELDARAVSAVGAGHRKRQIRENLFQVGFGGESVTARSAQRRKKLLAQARRGQRDRQRTPRPPEANPHHAAGPEPVLRYCASAADEPSASASSSVAVTVRIRSNRLMAKISATMPLSAATRS